MFLVKKKNEKNSKVANFFQKDGNKLIGKTKIKTIKTCPSKLYLKFIAF